MTTILDRTRTPVSERVRLLRQARGLTQRQLADRAGLSLEGVWTLENARKRPRTSTLRLLADALGVDHAELVPAPTPERKAS